LAEAAPVPSPCIDVCSLDADGGLCLGCGRTLSEIAEWGAASPERQREIVAAAKARRGG
jgi:predicted Fe-S protein YdhL (DUF1289 family)